MNDATGDREVFLFRCSGCSTVKALTERPKSPIMHCHICAVLDPTRPLVRHRAVYLESVGQRVFRFRVQG